MNVAKPGAARSPLRAALAAFWTGFTQPSLFALLGMAIMFVMTAIVIVISFTPERFAGPLGAYLLTSSEDVEGAATRHAFELASPRRAVSATPHLYVLGDSLIAQSLANEAKLNAAVEAQTGQTWATYVMTMGSQIPLDEAALVDYATSRQPGTVVLPMNFGRFDGDIKPMMRFYRMGRLGFRSDLADYQVKEILKERPRRRTGIFLFDNRFFYLRNARMMGLRLLLRNPVEQRVDNFREPVASEKLPANRLKIMAGLQRGYLHPKLLTELLTHTTKTIRARGSRVIFFQPPISKFLLENPVDYERFRIHLAKSEQLAKRLGAYYCKPPGDATLPTNLFADSYHLIDPAGQEAMRRVLARCVADMQRKGTAS